uniref:Carbohydrate kinase FGGY N-terminal domain-containing protein n=1 Tax=Ditylenchus dipsaci TaxID=166011 RepID=A0A915CXU1_9BILA
MSSTFLGIDIGTTTLKICLINEKKEIIKEADATPNATVKLDDPSVEKGHEQDPRKIVQSIFDQLQSFDLSKVNLIGISGQMHGVVLWNAESLFSADHTKISMETWECSNLITWMDHRCNKEFLSKLPKWPNETIATGFGSVTLAWLKQNNKLDSKWGSSGTIMDFIATLLTNNAGQACISTQNAHGWGYRCGQQWTIKDNSNFPCHLFPKIIPNGQIVGKTKNCEQFNLPENVGVLATMGDVQTSLMPILRENEAVIQLGTGSQIAFLVDDAKWKDELITSYPALTKVPYFNGKSVVVAVGMNAGNSLDVFVKQVAQWSHALFGIPMENMVLKPELLKNLFSESKTATKLEVRPVFYAERHSPGVYGTEVKNWTKETTAEDFLQAIARGIIGALAEMVPSTVISQCGLQDIRVVNRASQPIFEQAAKDYYPSMKIHRGTTSSASAAYGAALHALDVFTINK